MEQDNGAAVPAARRLGGFGVDTILAGALLFAGAILVLALAPSAYYAYLAIHILSAVIWVGGDVTLTVLGSCSSGVARGRRSARSVEWAPGSGRGSMRRRSS
jgi:hypothetical protein